MVQHSRLCCYLHSWISRVLMSELICTLLTSLSKCVYAWMMWAVRGAFFKFKFRIVTVLTNSVVTMRLYIKWTAYYSCEYYKQWISSKLPQRIMVISVLKQTKENGLFCGTRERKESLLFLPLTHPKCASVAFVTYGLTYPCILAYICGQVGEAVELPCIFKHHLLLNLFP